MKNIGIIGQGFVGTAVKKGLKKYYNIFTFDLDENKSSCKSLHSLVKNSNFIFICLPTPMNKDGSCNTDIVENVIKSINELENDISCKTQNKKIIIIKSTIPPGTTERLNKQYKSINIVFNPEFITEANYIDDFKNQDRIIIGGEKIIANIVNQLFYKAFPKAHIISTDSTTAEIVKYATNTFLSVKVSFANEIKMICDKINIDYNKVAEYSTLDKRLGKTHWKVPGPDGRHGFGGSCFPKDINALINLSENLGLNLFTIVGAWKTNLKVRPEQDWKELKGRAVIDE